MFHPPSKIMPMSNFKVLSHEQKDSKQFIDYYTGGPTLKQNEWITLEIKVQAINKIKRAFKNYLKRKKVLQKHE